MQGQRSSRSVADPFGFEPGSDNPDSFSSLWIEPEDEIPDPFSSIWAEPGLESPDPINAVNSLSLQTESNNQNLTRIGFEDENETRPRLACKRKNIEIGSTSNNNTIGASSSSNLYQNGNPNPGSLVGTNLMPVPVNYMSVPGLNDPSDDPFPGFMTQHSQNITGTGTGTSSQRSFRIRTGPPGGAIMANYNNNINLGHSILPPPGLYNNNNNDNNDNDNRRRFSMWGPPNNNSNNLNNDESANQNVTHQQHVFPLPPSILEPSVPVHRFPRNSRIGTSASTPIDLETTFGSNNNNHTNNNHFVIPPPGMGGDSRRFHHHHRNFSEEMGAAGRMAGTHHNQGPPRLRPSFLLDRAGSASAQDVWAGPLSLRGRDGRRILQIRNALEMMRRGDNLRFENIYSGGIEMHDRHREMRLDIDNMSYEELLALEERIGNVNTGLNEESIQKLLNQFEYTSIHFDTYQEPCCICQEEYNEGEELGRLDCGHDFHAPCIKQWLLHKNMCPICKSTALIP